MSSFYENCGNDKPLSIIAGPCVYETKEHAMFMAKSIIDICDRVGKEHGIRINYIYKTSFDKANRTSAESFRGIGFDEGYYGLKAIQSLDIPVLTDIHEPWQCDAIAANVIQIPAFLCRQTDLLSAAAQSGCTVNVKKGQFLSPKEMMQVVKKLQHFGAKEIMITERGTTFGYNNLVVDMRGLEIMKEAQVPVILDCTHAVQEPGGLGTKSGGNREMAKVLARAGTAVGIAGLFLEVHNDPDNAPSDGPNMIHLNDLYALLTICFDIDLSIKKYAQNK